MEFHDSFLNFISLAYMIGSTIVTTYKKFLLFTEILLIVVTRLVKTGDMSTLNLSTLKLSQFISDKL